MIRHKKRNRYVNNFYLSLFFLIIPAFFLLSGCLSSSISGRTGKGINIEADFVDGSPPQVIYYDPSNNEIMVTVSLYNKGYSNAYGAVYLSGYDPLILEFENSTPPQSGLFCNIQPVSKGSDLLSVFVQHTGGYVEDWKNFVVGVRCKESSLFLGRRAGEWNFRFDTDFLRELFNINFGSNSAIGSILNNLSIDVQKVGKDWFIDFGADLLSDNVYYFGDELVAILRSTGSLNYGGYGKTFLIYGDNEKTNGEKQYIDFNGRIKSMPSKEVRTTIMATILYGYTTYGSTDICLDPVPYKDEKKSCKFTYRKSFDSRKQNAPVIVESMEQQYAGNKMLYTLYVRHIGKGRVINIDALAKASPAFKDMLTAKDIGVVKVSKFFIGSDMATCENDGEIYLDDNGRGTISCYLDISKYKSVPAFTTPVMVELWYGYEKVIEKPLIIKKI